ncbi:DUF3613 domain-containing protein [Oceanococcus atlanticus]|uniref:DUF3613 domain-containing protein n=1 Tax=Oceanococcus atlanticus TaxID=1317117 RepID=UPI00131413D0|nr:DUF3613 domain-containing protein [Oceanococcus atlanticus]
MTAKTLLSASLFLVCTATLAESPRVGTTTQEWIDLQKSGVEAPADDRPMQGDVAKRTYQRYLKSFEKEVPEQFETESSLR